MCRSRFLLGALLIGSACGDDSSGAATNSAAGSGSDSTGATAPTDASTTLADDTTPTGGSTTEDTAATTGESTGGPPSSGCGAEPAFIPHGFVGNLYFYEPATVGGLAPHTWSATGLPPGLELDAATGAISGVPTEPGTFPIVLAVTDAEGVPQVGQCGELLIARPLAVDTQALLAAYPDGCVSFGVTLDELRAQGVVKHGDDTPVQCVLRPGRGSGAQDFDNDPSTPGTLPSGISIDGETCELKGSVDDTMAFGIYTWIITLEQSWMPAYLPYCAAKATPAATAYPIVREDGGVAATLSPGLAFQDPFGVEYGTDAPDPLVRVTYNKICDEPCFYSYIFSYNTLTIGADVFPSPDDKFPEMGFEGFTHGIRVSESAPDLLESFEGRPWVVNLRFNYCIGETSDVCTGQDPFSTEELILKNGGNTSYEFGLIILPD